MFLEIPLLSFVIWLPIIIGFSLLFFKENNQGIYIAKYTSLFITIFSLYLCYLLYNGFDLNLWEMQFVENEPWISELGIFYSLGVDGISLPLIILNCYFRL